jgi:20S proteasome alpha/beta subunit
LTTIACNREEMYGDLQYTNTVTGGKFKGNGKVYKFDESGFFDFPYLIGFTGTASDVAKAVSYLARPDLFKKAPVARVSGLVLTQKKEIFLFEDYLNWMKVKAKYHAMGSGCTFALGAMAKGASPKEAVKVAMQFDCYTGMGVQGFKNI